MATLLQSINPTKLKFLAVSSFSNLFGGNFAFLEDFLGLFDEGTLRFSLTIPHSPLTGCFHRGYGRRGAICQPMRNRSAERNHRTALRPRHAEHTTLAPPSSHPLRTLMRSASLVAQVGCGGMEQRSRRMVLLRHDPYGKTRTRSVSFRFFSRVLSLLMNHQIRSHSRLRPRRDRPTSVRRGALSLRARRERP